MKTNKIIAVIVLFTTAFGFSQPQFKEKREQIKALKVAFITNELDLTADEATKFWPIYNAFEEKQHQIKFEKMKDFFENDQNVTLSDKEATLLLTQMENSEDELYQLRKKFITNLKGVLSPTKIIKLKKTEDKFKRKLLQQYRNGKN